MKTGLDIGRDINEELRAWYRRTGGRGEWFELSAKIAAAIEARDASHATEIVRLRSALQDCTAAMAMQVGRENETLHIKQEVAREIWDDAYAKGLAAIAKLESP